MENKLVAYYKVGCKYDSVLDSLEVQRKRITEWCEEFGFNVVDEFIDTEQSERNERTKAFDYSDKRKLKVVVASACRLSDTPLELLEMKEDKNGEDRFISVEFGELSNLDKNHIVKPQVDFMMTTIIGLREKYISDCIKFVK